MNLELWQLIIAFLSTSSISAILGAVVTGIINRKIRDAKIDDIQASAAQKVVEAAGGLLESMSAKIAELEEENKEIRCELDLIRAQHKETERKNQVLKSRIKLLAKIVTQIVRANDTASCVDDLLNGMKITPEERRFLTGIVEEANDIKWIA